MRNLLLIGINSKYTHSNLAIRYMRSYANVPIAEFTINDDIFSVYRKLLNIRSDYLCFSVYIWNVEFITKLCGMLLAARPDIRIIFGGPEAGYDAENMLHKYPWLTAVITGEGEQAVLDLKNGVAFAQIPNFVYRDGEEVIHTPLQKTDLSRLIFPYTEEEIKGTLQNRIIYFETTRGCLFRCAYCLSSAEGKTRFFPMDYVKKGLLFFMENSVPLVKLVDRTFNEDRARATEIVAFILEHNKCTRFHFEIAPQLLTDEFIALCAQKPETFQFEMGIQTTNPETMRVIHRAYDIDKTAEKIKKIPQSIHQHLDSIAGLPCETLETFAQGFNYVYQLNPHMLQLGFLKLLKHTQMHAIAKDYAIKTTDFPPFEVLSTNTMSAEDIILLKKMEIALDRIYNTGAFRNTLQQICDSNPFAFYKKIGEKLYEKELSAPLSRSDLYVFMYELFPEAKKSLVVDFLQNNHKAKLPNILEDTNENAKQLHKKLVQSDMFRNKKVRLVFAAECVFAVTEEMVTELDQNTL